MIIIKFRVWVWRKCVLSENRPGTQVCPVGNIESGEKVGCFYMSDKKEWILKGNRKRGNHGKIKVKHNAAGSSLQEVSVMYFLFHLYTTQFTCGACTGCLPLGYAHCCASLVTHFVMYGAVMCLLMASFAVHERSALFSDLCQCVWGSPSYWTVL